MQLLLIGCSGFIGRELIPNLLEAGHNLTVISRKSAQKYSNFLTSKNFELLQIDPSKTQNWQKDELINALDNADCVINLAGEPIAEKRWTENHLEVLRSSRLQTTKSLVNAMKELKKPPKTLINASAIGFYGTSQNKIYSEDNSSGKDFLSSLCREWEAAAMEKPKQTRLVIFRIGIVLGADGGALGKMLPVFRSGFGGPIGDGKQWMSWIHRKDLCSMIEKAMKEKNWNGSINAVSPNPVSMAKFSESLGKTLGRPTILPVPGPLLKILLGDGARVVLEGQKVESKKLSKLNYNFKFPSLAEALNDIANSKDKF